MREGLEAIRPRYEWMQAAESQVGSGSPAGKRHDYEAFIPVWRLKKACPLAILLDGHGLRHIATLALVRESMALRIEDYAIIGDCKSAALVGSDGSIDWLCWPRFDSAACFAALLGTPENGRWLIAPALAPLGVTRRYRPGTLVLETEFKTESARAVILDFMPPADGAELVRIVVGRSGRVDFRTEFVARFDYGSTVPWISRLYDGAISAVAGPERLVLRSSVALSGEDFTVEEGQSAAFVLSYGAS